jgi:ketosteroid isomerase-like protein
MSSFGNPVGAVDEPSTLSRRSLLTNTGVGLLVVASGLSFTAAAATTSVNGDAALKLARQWMDMVNRRDAGLGSILTDDFHYSAMARNPPELAVRWDKEKFLGIAKSTAGFRKPVVMKTVSEFATGDRAVIEAEGYSERDDGYVYANVYCFNFWTDAGRIKAIHDYCCTHTAWLHGQHVRGADQKAS